MQHLSRDARETRGLGESFEPVLAVTEQGVSECREVASDLMGTAGVDGDVKIAGIGFGAYCSDASHGIEAVEWLVDDRVARLEPARHDGAVRFADLSLGEQLDSLLEDRVIYCEQHATGGVGIQAVYGAQRGDCQLNLKP